jgi:hypothetical protein
MSRNHSRAYLKKTAIQLVAQLPADLAEAREILRMCDELVERFLADDVPTAKLVSIKGAQS